MNGKTLVASLKRMSEITEAKQITHLTHALFPGTHCPLMGAALAIRGIQDAMMMVVGTDECVYYTKNLTVGGDEFGGLSGRCVSVVLDQHDVTFGSREKVIRAFQELTAEYKPKLVFIVTTCLVEIIGDDIDAVADELSEEYNIVVMPVHTEHFKCENHIPGITRTLEACVDMMERTPCDESVNILGQRMGSFQTTELFRVLKQAGVKIGLQLPSNCSSEEIKAAPAAKVNIIVNETALPMAKKMKRKFGTPYILFDKFVDPDRILKAYEGLFQSLQLPFPKELYQWHAEAKKAVKENSATLKDITYIYGNTPFRSFEFNRFMMELGMIPLIIQTASLPKEDEADITFIRDHADPYLVLPANIAPLQYVYDELKPNFYLGHEYADRLRKKGISLVRSDQAAMMLGFEITHLALQSLSKAAENLREMQKEAEAV